LIEEKKNSELQAETQTVRILYLIHLIISILGLKQSEKALPAIEELSQLLRYSTKDLEKDFISLEKEVGYLESLIELEKLRIKNPELLIINKNQLPES
jgi:LytS/YehU family sensor histidine kinase